MPAAYLALDELCAVVNDPAYRRIREPRGRGVLLAPCDHTLCRVHMAHARPRLCAGDGRSARIAEEVQDADRPTGGADLPHRPVPVRGLFGEEPGVLEVHGLDVEGQFAVAYLPVLRKVPFVPAAAARLAAAIARVAVVPMGVAARGVPYRLRVGAHEVIAPPALQLLSLGTVYKLKILPFICDPHISLRFPPCRFRSRGMIITY